MEVKDTYIVGTITDVNNAITGYLYLDFTLFYWFLATIIILLIIKQFKNG